MVPSICSREKNEGNHAKGGVSARSIGGNAGVGAERGIWVGHEVATPRISHPGKDNENREKQQFEALRMDYCAGENRRDIILSS